MSFMAQEQLMLDLLFDRDLRKVFAANPHIALKAYDLTENEMDDFLCIRPEALELDAAIRADLVLSQMIRHFPMSFALFSSCPKGVESIKLLVDCGLIKEEPLERAVYFGNAMGVLFNSLTGIPSRENPLVKAVLDAEVAMAYIASSLKKAVLEQGVLPVIEPCLHDNWLHLPINLAPFVTAAVLPLPYSDLKKTLCQCEGAELWRQLNVSPVTVEQRQKIFARPDIRLMLSRACVTRYSPCDPVIDFTTAELSEGFAPLFQYINGEYSIAFILHELQKAGAEAGMLETIKRQFLQLLESGMLECMVD